MKNILNAKYLRWGLLGSYCLAFIISFAQNGLPVARMPILGWVSAAFIVGNVGKPRRKQLQMIGDLTLYACMWFSYDFSRGIADSLGFPLQVELPRNIDKVLFLGNDPNTWMQQQLWNRNIQWYDVYGSIIYFTHFVVPVAMSVYLWIRYREQWVRYIRRFATVLFTGVATYMMMPTVPPWMASSTKFDYQILEPLQRSGSRGWSWLGLDTVGNVLISGQQQANPTAAFPSLHAAFALFVVVFFWQQITKPWVRYMSLLFPLSMAWCLVYFGEHYVTDIVAGWAYVGASFWFWNRWEAKRQVTEPLA
jgi:membrane-associated phospholipid phosphatase